jgi:hypothetical protein
MIHLGSELSNLIKVTEVRKGLPALRFCLANTDKAEKHARGTFAEWCGKRIVELRECEEFRAILREDVDFAIRIVERATGWA